MKCPECGSENITKATDWGPTGGSTDAFQPHWCNDCGLKFTPWDLEHKYRKRRKK